MIIRFVLNWSDRTLCPKAEIGKTEKMLFSPFERAYPLFLVVVNRHHNHIDVNRLYQLNYGRQQAFHCW